MSQHKRPSASLTGLWIASGIAFAASSPLFAADAAPATGKTSETPNASAPKLNSLENAGDEAEHVNIENIKQKYWARGNEDELGVVQNRMFTKEHKLEFGFYVGTLTTDPFLTVYNLSATLGYHINEYLSFGVFARKDYVSPSSALTLLRTSYQDGGAGSDTSTNRPNWYLGGEAMASIMYGKLSLVGKAIIHYDFHFTGGLGATSTFSGTYFTPSLGVGQQFFITRWATLRFDYRLMVYNETILQQVGSPSSPNGTPLGTRVNYSNTITIGVSFLVDPFGKKPPAEDTSAQPSTGAPVQK